MKKRFICIALLPLLFAAPALAGRAETASIALQAAEAKKWGPARLTAERSGDKTLQALVDWLYLSDMDSGAIFDDYALFIANHPNWPKETRLKLRAEQSLRISDPGDATLAQWFKENPPVSGLGKLRQAQMLMRNGKSRQDPAIVALLRDAWKDGDFEEAEERFMLTNYANILRSEDHIARADRLLWEEKTGGAKRMIDLLPPHYKDLTRARIALISDAKDANFHVSRVPNNLKSTPGLLYARMLYRVRRDDANGVNEMLLAAPAEVPYPEKWWRYRERRVREAIDDNNIKLAARLLANHGQKTGQPFADATWLHGWLLLEFQNKPQAAYQEFYKMFQAVRFPVSRARGAYWAGRAAEKSGDKASAENWYTTASAYPTTFYGQLAQLKRRKGAPLALSAEPQATEEQKQSFARLPLVDAIRVAAQARSMDLASAFLYHLIDTAESDAHAALAAKLGAEIHNTMLGVRGAKHALQRNVVVPSVGYPRVKLPDELTIEPSLALAITRQESEFDPYAKSPSNALGMMQLLPSTAKEVARKNDIPFTQSKLYEPQYNIRLGSIYLGRLISGYDGSYVQAIAGYNAGPSRVRSWTARFGSPGNSVDGVVNWIEKIPFTETRNYVHRVLENLQVYRALSNGNTPLKLDADLTRG